MRALSVRQPWAWLIVNGFKPIENRNWPTSYRGEILIHASKTCARKYYGEVMESLRSQFGRDCQPVPAFDDLERGGVVGVARIVDCVSDTLSLGSRQVPWFQGEYGWVLEDARPLAFHPAKGALSFFDVRGVQL